MYRRLVLTALAFVTAVTPLPAAPREERDIKVQRMRPENAACLIKRRPGPVRTWLASLPGTKGERDAIRPVEQDFNACFTYFPNAYVSTWDYPGIRRGLIAELLRTKLAHLPDQSPAGLARVAWFPPEQAAETNAAPALLANDLGFCLARTDWSTTRTLAKAEHGSTAEKAALAALVPRIAGCLPPGQRLRLDTERLRTILLETVYHATLS